MIYNIDIENDADDKFEAKADNVAVFQIFDDKGNDITASSKANLFLSKNALLGLGTELIRLAHNFQDGKHLHLEPTEKDMMVQRLGIFLTPDSGKIVVGCGEMKTIDEYFE